MKSSLTTQNTNVSNVLSGSLLADFENSLRVFSRCFKNSCGVSYNLTLKFSKVYPSDFSKLLFHNPDKYVVLTSEDLSTIFMTFNEEIDANYTLSQIVGSFNLFRTVSNKYFKLLLDNLESSGYPIERKFNNIAAFVEEPNSSFEKLARLIEARKSVLKDTGHSISDYDKFSLACDIISSYQ